MACLLSNSILKYVANLVCKPFNNALTSASQTRLLMLFIFDLIPKTSVLNFHKWHQYRLYIYKIFTIYLHCILYSVHCEV